MSILPDVGLPGAPPAPAMRDLDDIKATRTNIYNQVLNAARGIEPVKNQLHTLSLDQVDYDGPDKVPLAKQKEAILTGQSLFRRLKGRWQLTDNATGKVLGQRTSTVATVPHYTERGTFIVNGNEYTIASQMRLRPGVFTRIKSNGEIESHVNTLPGKGLSHRINFDPESNIFRIQIGQSRMPLFPLLRILGSSDKDLQKAWGNDIFAANRSQDDPKLVDRLYQRLIGTRGTADTTEGKGQAVREFMEKMELDPEVTRRTLGAPIDRVNADTLLRTTRRLVAVNRGDEDSDDRDHLAYQQFFGPEDLLSERMRTAGTILRPLLWKLTLKRNLDSMQPGVLSKHLMGALLHSGLGMSGEEVNPTDMFDQQLRVSRMGEGGIPSPDSVPDESRSVQTSHFGYIDPLRTPESIVAGVDSRMASAVRKGSDGRVYTPLLNIKTGKTDYLSPQDVADKVIAFPGEMEQDQATVAALDRGKIRYVPRKKVDLVSPVMDNAFSPLANLIPLKSMTKGQRVVMGSRMLTQALPLDKPEAPHVQTAMPGNPDRSYEEHYGRHMGTLHADQAGEVVAVKPDKITIRTADGKTQDHELYQWMPFNRKTYLHNTPVVQVGQTVKPGELLAHSNYTTPQGTTALGLNLRVAYIPHPRSNFEDAILISESAAKKLSSVHMYQHGAEWDDRSKRGKNTFVSLFPATFERKILDTLDDDGVVKPGTEVGHGQPLVLKASERERAHNQVSRSKGTSFSDQTVTWDHEIPGIVTDVAKTKKGVLVSVRSINAMQQADKLVGRHGDKSTVSYIIPDHEMPTDAKGQPFEVLANPLGVITRCYDAQTEFLTQTGWKYGSEVLPDDELVIFDPRIHISRWGKQIAPIHVADYDGIMYGYKNKILDFLVTPGHKMWTRTDISDAIFTQRTIEQVYGKRHYIPVIAQFKEDPNLVATDFLLPVIARTSVKDRYWSDADVALDAHDWAEFLGWYMAEGSFTWKPGQDPEYRIHIAQSYTANPGNCQKIATLLDRLPFRWYYLKGNKQFHISSKRLTAYLRPFGKAEDKHIPAWIFTQPASVRSRFLEGYWLGDGSVRFNGSNGARVSQASSVSRQLIDDLQRLLIMQGESTAVYVKKEREECQPAWTVSRHHPRSCKRHDLEVSRLTNRGGWYLQNYHGKVYCPSVETGYVLVRRNGKVCIAGNTNPSQMVEAALGKIAAITGKPYKVPDFQGNQDMTEYALAELKKHGLPDTEDIIDPITGRKIRNVFTGNRFFLKLHHLAECFDDETEALTSRGWVPWPEVKDDDELATMDQGKLIFEKPLRVIRSPYHGELYCFSGRYVDYAVTPNHNLYCRFYHDKKRFRFEEASELHGRRFGILQFGVPVPECEPTHGMMVGDRCIAWEDYAELVGWWASEGYARVTHRRADVVLYQSLIANPGNFAKIVRLAERLPFSWHYHKSKGEALGVRISSRDLAGHLKSFGTHSYNKRLPRELLDQPPSVLQHLYDAMLDGDGDRQGEQIGWMSARYVTTSPGLADDFQELCIRMGLGAITHRCKERSLMTINAGGRSYVSNCRQAWICGVALRRTVAQIDGDRNRSNFSIRPYQGMVYCAEMRTGLLYVRRNGKPMWSGNSKGQGRGLGGYTSEERPSRSGEHTSKKMSLWDLNALLSHGAHAVAKDTVLVRGQKNLDYWTQYMSGNNPTEPQIPLVHRKFYHMLQAAGINPVKQGLKTRIMAMTDKDVDELAGDRNIQNADTVDWKKGLKPLEGGLFAQELTGGHGGNRWAALPLTEPMVNPVMEDPVRRILGLTQEQFEETLAGRNKLPNGQTGPDGIYKALDSIKLDPAIAEARGMIASGRKTQRDEGVRRLYYLKSAKALNLHPRDWMLKRIPILPPVFRPVSVMMGNQQPLISDANYLYKELFEANLNLKTMRDQVEDVGDERLAVYHALKGVTGLGEPITPKNQERKVQGILAQVFADSPKFSMVQSKLLGSNVDVVGRSVVVPNPDMDMDHIGIPEKHAWEIYKPFIMRRLTRGGVNPLRAAELVKNQDELARKALIEETSKRPVIVTRAPVLHRYGVMAFYPKLATGDAIQASPLIVTGFNLDFDGDQMNFHVPVGDDAVKDAIDKMLPSRNLLSVRDFKVHQLPKNEYLGGLYQATSEVNDKHAARTYQTKQDAIRAYRRGEINADTKVVILEP